MEFFIYPIALLISCVIWGVATDTIVRNKGYEDNWFWWGFFFGLIALIVAACKPQVTVSYNSNALRPTDNAGRPLTSAPKSVPAGSWKCSCGRVNPGYVGTCVCGQSKHNAEARAQEHAVGDTELNRINLLKQYKELLDAGVLTQEEFEKKKADILGK